MTALLLDLSSSSNNGGDCGELTPGLAVAVVAGPSGGPGACSSFSVTLTQVGLALVLPVLFCQCSVHLDRLQDCKPNSESCF